MTSGNGNNETGYASPEYDKLLADSLLATGAARIELLQKAEATLVQDMPIIPIYFYTRSYLIVGEREGLVPEPARRSSVEVHLPG